MYNEIILRKVIAKKTKEFRSNNNLTREALAREMGVPEKEIVDIENGKSEITLRTLANLTNALGLTADELFHLEHGDSELEEVIRMYTSVDEETQKSLRTILRALTSNPNKVKIH